MLYNLWAREWHREIRHEFQARRLDRIASHVPPRDTRWSNGDAERRNMKHRPDGAGVRTRFLRMGAGLLLAVALPVPAHASDWPMYRHDAQRSGVTAEKLAFPLHPVWSVRAAQPPRPAWPEPTHVLNRMDFDYAFEPVVAGGAVFFGSSADDTLRALDLRTGREKWHFIANGPIRFAPHVDSGRVYFADDAGMVYALDAANGALAWQFRAAPADEQLVGNGRMISRWPVRTGVLVDNGIVYAVAGMWPAEGVYVYALRATDGTVVWCNDTGAFGKMYFRDQPEGVHQSEYYADGVLPQGALLASKDVLLVPKGHSFPCGIDRRTGKAAVRRRHHGQQRLRRNVGGDRRRSVLRHGRAPGRGPWAASITASDRRGGPWAQGGDPPAFRGTVSKAVSDPR